MNEREKRIRELLKAKEEIEKIGGRLEIEEEKGKGRTISVYLPIEEVSPEETYRREEFIPDFVYYQIVKSYVYWRERAKEVYFDPKVRKEYLTVYLRLLAYERWWWIKRVSRFDDPSWKQKSWKRRMIELIFLPLDWIFFFVMFQTASKIVKFIFEATDLNLEERKLENLFKKLKKEIQLFRFFDRKLVGYCRLDFFFYDEIIGLLKRDLLKPGEQEMVNKRIKEILFQLETG